MTTLEQVREIQTIVGATPDGVPGPKTKSAVAALFASAATGPAIPQLWPYTVIVDGEDLCVCDIVITCFGGSSDPQDDGNTASGVNTRKNPNLQGVSVAMDGRQFNRLGPAEQAALNDAPLPRMPWGTLVEVTINGVTQTPSAGIIDLGPGLHASKPGEPHALDLTPAAAALFEPTLSRDRLSRYFEARGSFRILGAAKYLQT